MGSKLEKRMGVHTFSINIHVVLEGKRSEILYILNEVKGQETTTLQDMFETKVSHVLSSDNHRISFPLWLISLSGGISD